MIIHICLYNTHSLKITRHFTLGKLTKLKLTFGSRFDTRNERKSPLAIYGSTMSGRLSSVSKHTPSNFNTLGWSNPSIKIDSFTKSFMLSGVETSVRRQGQFFQGENVCDISETILLTHLCKFSKKYDFMYAIRYGCGP